MDRSSSQLFRMLLLGLLTWGVMLTLLVCMLDRHGFHRIFSEGGPVEAITTPLWVMLAAWCLRTAWPPNRELWTCGLIALLLAMREADWQHDPVVNMSRLKFKYYAQPLIPLQDKIFVAICTLAALAIITYGLILAVRHLLKVRSDALRPQWAKVFLVGLIVLAGVKLLDRMINGVVDLTGHRISGLAGRLIGGYEEGFELALPLIFALSLYCYLRQVAASG
jgi:hypothetical protein